MNQQIPFFSLERQYKRLQTKLEAAAGEVLASQQYVGGAYVAQFESDLATYCGVSDAVACNSGTDALWLALKTLHTKPGDLVLTTPFSFIASSSEIIALGAQPVYVDIDPQTFNLSPDLLRAWLEEHATTQNGTPVHKTTGQPIRGILAVNIFGQCADYERIRRIADEWNLWIIEDAAQSIGSTVHGKKAGSFGDIATFSFYPTKNLGACGDAGALVTNNEEYAQRARSLRNHGRHTHYDYLEQGINSRMDALQAALLSTKLPYLDEWNTRRRAIAHHYYNLLSDVPNILLPQEHLGTHTYHQYSILITSSPDSSHRDAAKSHLTKQGVGINIFYPCPLYDVSYIRDHTPFTPQCPVADKTVQQVLALPIWPELTDTEVEYVAHTLRAWAASSTSSQRKTVLHEQT